MLYLLGCDETVMRKHALFSVWQLICPIYLFFDILDLMCRIAITDVAAVECAVANRINRNICGSVIPPLCLLLMPFLLDGQVNEDDGHTPPVGL